MEWYPADDKVVMLIHLDHEAWLVDGRVEMLDIRHQMDEEEAETSFQSSVTLALFMEDVNNHELQFGRGCVWFKRPPNEDHQTSNGKSREVYAEPPFQHTYSVKAPGGYTPWGSTDDLKEARAIMARAHEEDAESVAIRVNTTGQYIS